MSQPFSPRDRALYTAINTSTAPLFALMVLAPRAPVTARAVRLATPLQAALGVSYAALLVRGWGGERVDFRDPDSVRRGLATTNGFLAGWAHYLAFDLFVGRWVWQQGLETGRSSRVAVLLCWVAGPAGLTTWLAQDALSRARARRR